MPRVIVDHGAVSVDHVRLPRALPWRVAWQLGADVDGVFVPENLTGRAVMLTVRDVPQSGVTVTAGGDVYWQPSDTDPDWYRAGYALTVDGEMRVTGAFEVAT